MLFCHESEMILVILLTITVAGYSSNIFILGEEVEVSFRNFSYSDDDHVDVEIELPPYSETKAFLNNIPEGVDFIIFQVHSYVYNVILSYDSKLSTHNYVNGTNIGLYSNTTHTPIFYIKNPNDFNVSCMIAAVPYTNESPVPGGCNMELPIPIAPFLSVQTTESMIIIDGPPASLSKKCDMNILAYVMFYKFLLQTEFSVKAYFDSIRSMLTYPRILKSSYLAPKPIDGPSLRRTFSRYGGVGSIYSLIALNKFGNVAVYTPSFMFPSDNFISFESFTVAFKLELAALILICVFLCFGGHRYFIGELFFFGAIGGCLLSYILLFHETVSDGDLLLFCNGIGFVCGILWSSLWWFSISSPVICVILPFIMNGLLISSMTMYTFYFLFGDVTIFENNINYFVTFLSVTTIVVLISTTDLVRYNVIACAMVGSYGIMLPFDIIFGTSFKYLVVNVLKRVTIEGFNLAILRPPLQIADVLILLVWLLLFLKGIKCQKILSLNRPPFLPVHSTLRDHMVEATPILSSSKISSYT